jgi:type IV pilus assembly protein PilZ
LTGPGAQPYGRRVSSDDDDRRFDPRAPIELRVEYKRLNSFFADYTKNISRGGTFIRTEKPLAIGTDFVFKLGIPQLEEPLTLQGKVQWVVMPEEATPEQEAGMGIGFIFESEADRQRVEGSVERLMVDSLGQVLFRKLIGNRKKEH